MGTEQEDKPVGNEVEIKSILHAGPSPSPSPTPTPTPKNRKLKVGDRYVINYERKAPIALATIKVLTDEPGRHVGVEFETPVGPYADNGNCYGTCQPGHGLWVHPQHLITEDEYKALVAQGELAQTRMVKKVDELEFDATTGAVKTS